MRKISFLFSLFLLVSCSEFQSFFEGEFPIMDSDAVKAEEDALSKETFGDFSTYMEEVELEDAKRYEELNDLRWYTSRAISAGSMHAKKGGVFYTYLHDFPNTFCYTTLRADVASKKLFQNHIPLLVRSIYDRAFLPGVASHWAFGSDGKTVYYKLNIAAKWSDGAKCTADDFLFAIEFMRSKEILKLSEDLYSHLSIKKISQEYIMVRFEGDLPKSKELLLDATNIVPRAKHFYNGIIPSNWTIEYNRKAEPTTGAYYLENWNFNYGLTFKKVVNWWAEEYSHFQNMFNFDAVELRILPGTQFSVRKYFRAQQLDALPIFTTDEYFSALEDGRFRRGMADMWKIKTNSLQGLSGIVFNTKAPPFNNLDFRMAMEYAIDIDGLIENVLGGDAKRCNTMGENQGCDGILFNNTEIRANPYDKEKAISLLQRAGFDVLDKNGIRWNKEGEKASFMILYQDKELKDVFGYLYAKALECGIELDFRFFSGGILEKIKEGKFQAWWTSFLSSDIPNNYYLLHSSPSST